VGGNRPRLSKAVNSVQRRIGRVVVVRLEAFVRQWCASCLGARGTGLQGAIQPPLHGSANALREYIQRTGRFCTFTSNLISGSGSVCSSAFAMV